ncbi:hypothetical protein [Helicobacter sp. 11S03491-1]|uniref:hypothetical protein n=1 Tax=Helicobacter sp. 11S03491-1 TaxID=1476196 RepID=UPI000BA583B1|nr:hypothetical protein [Helicobacter sp. 11S03491-1]PAF41989.1 hypothetical protein BKH45_05240 [Helicobacter sp. 11S03491-1]
MQYLNSINSVSKFFLILLGITLGSFFFFAPSKYLQDTTSPTLAKIELEDFNMYQVNAKSVDMKIEGAKALQFKDYEVLYGFLASRYNTQSKESYEYISGEEVVKKGDIYHFPKGATYIKSDGGSFWSQSGTYDYRKEIFKGNGSFILSTLEGNFEGKNIIYNKKIQNITATDIISKILLDTNEKKDQK